VRSLCSQHHRLVHEGGYSIRTDYAGRRYFKRPDGKAVPECGYHESDWLDEGFDAIDGPSDSKHSVLNPNQNSAEFSGVKEPQAAYSLVGLYEAA